MQQWLGRYGQFGDVCHVTVCHRTGQIMVIVVLSSAQSLSLSFEASQHTKVELADLGSTGVIFRENPE